MRLTVVIPTLNASASLAATLQSLGSFPAEVLVADGGSSDTTAAIATAFGARVLKASRGRGPQLQAGTGASESPWLLLLHADTYLSPGWESAVRRHAMDHPDRAGYFRFALRSADPHARRLEALVAWRCRFLALPYGDQGLLIARTLLQQVGGIRPLILMEDVDLVRRLGRSRLAPLDATATTSAERWESGGWYRRSALNLLCLSLWAAGVPATRLARLYR